MASVLPPDGAASSHALESTDSIIRERPLHLRSWFVLVNVSRLDVVAVLVNDLPRDRTLSPRSVSPMAIWEPVDGSIGIDDDQAFWRREEIIGHKGLAFDDILRCLTLGGPAGYALNEL